MVKLLWHVWFYVIELLYCEKLTVPIMKHNNFIPALIFSLLFTLGSCNSSDDLLDTFVNESEQSYLSSLQVKDLNFNTETVEITKHIKFENDSFYLDITLEEAIRHNISKDIYYKCNDRLEVHNKEVKEIIDRGGKYTFTNQFAEINLQKINIDELRTKTLTPPFMGYGGYLTYPGNNDISLLFPDDTIFRGFSFWFNSEVVYKNGSPGVAIIWYTYRVDGRDKNGMLC